MKCISTLLMLGVIAAAVADTADAQTSYVRYEQAGVISWGELDGSTIRQLSDAPYLGGTRTGRTVMQSAVTMKAPVDPTLVFMTAFNFRSHISGEPAEYPGLFTVPASSIIGSGENIVRPPGSENLHYEAEMVIVIGRRAENVSPEDAPDYIFGVSAGNDVSERAWQGGDIQWVRAKGSRTFNAVGPVLVAGLDYTNLQIEGRLNGDVRQGENTADLIFNMNHMVSYISKYFTLEPGDLIWSGTMGRTRAMEPGDVYEVEIEGIGILRNQVVQGH
ncbi:MAG: fumarylacetoacetate hydrolase family protein [Gemmatimonadetes bacterium]|jgi:2-keto-4-pentenoate hydratase/2-oxohepta-3-ene-1,7-dioic acid hydratase in catechol pathway|nr:fumarylacetoacetate hydrolase family protein [Gemmatimonadota bacterium]